MTVTQKRIGEIRVAYLEVCRTQGTEVGLAAAAGALEVLSGILLALQDHTRGGDGDPPANTPKEALRQHESMVEEISAASSRLYPVVAKIDAAARHRAQVMSLLSRG